MKLAISVIVAFVCASLSCALLIGRNLSNERAATVEPPVSYLPAPIHEFYEDQNGLHVITAETVADSTVYGDVLIELKDEENRYSFDIDGWNYELDFFRTGNPSDGIQAVYVVFRGQIYSIDSHRLSPSRLAGMRTWAK